jgi:hypothetical protein
MPSLPEPAPAEDLLNEALQQVGAGSEEARTIHRGLRQLKGFASEDLPGKSVRAVSEAILTARLITGRQDRVKLPARA